MEVLLKLSMYPCRNYSGADMVDYKIVKEETANIIKEFLHKYKKEQITFYCGFDGCCSLKNVTIEIYSNKDIIRAYKLLTKEQIVSKTYYVYDLVVEALMLINENYETCYDMFDSNVSEDAIIRKWHNIC